MFPILLCAWSLAFPAAAKPAAAKPESVRKGHVGFVRVAGAAAGDRWVGGTAGPGIEVVRSYQGKVLVVDDTVRALTLPLGEEPGGRPLLQVPQFAAALKGLEDSLGRHDRILVGRIPSTMVPLRIDTRTWIWARSGGEVHLVATEVGLDTALITRIARVKAREEGNRRTSPKAKQRQRADEIARDIAGTLETMIPPRHEFELRVWSSFDGARLAKALGACIGDTLCELDDRFDTRGDEASFWPETAPASWYALPGHDTVSLQAPLEMDSSVVLSWRAARADLGGTVAEAGDSASLERNRPRIEAILRPWMTSLVESFSRVFQASPESSSLAPTVDRLVSSQADRFLGFRGRLRATRPGRGPVQTDSDLVAVPAGCFTMGSDTVEDASPAHRVCLDSFRIARREVTRRDFAMVMGRHPWRRDSTLQRGPELPAVDVDWDDARLYCHRVGRRLPTEAEFEYLLRGADSLPPWKEAPSSACHLANLGDSGLNRSEAKLQAAIDSAIGQDEDGDYADWKEITARRSEIFPCHDGFPDAAPGGRFPADRHGILDLWGNVREWTADRYGSYEELPERNPVGAELGDERVVRGGSWKQGPTQVTPWNRTPAEETHKASDLGFRCAAD